MSGNQRPSPIVFLGPTLSASVARQLLDAIILPPVAQGAVVRAVFDHQPSVILIVDGTFQGEPAVRHKEILWAVSRGIPVIGAASMGALRAAELFPHMRGVGLIYRWYRRFAFAPDDAVAVLHAPAELGSEALTLAEIDLRLTFRSAERAGLLKRGERMQLEASARKMNFRDRVLQAVVAGAFPALDTRDVMEKAATLVTVFVNQKRRDALLALKLVAAGEFSIPPRTAFRMTDAFACDLEDSGIDSASVPVEGPPIIS
jgi:hypothetical protein